MSVWLCCVGPIPYLEEEERRPFLPQPFPTQHCTWLHDTPRESSDRLSDTAFHVCYCDARASSLPIAQLHQVSTRELWY